MKLQHKLLIIFVFFIGFFILNNHNCYGATEEVYQRAITIGFENMDDYYNAFVIYNHYSRNYADILLFNKDDNILVYDIRNILYTSSSSNATFKQGYVTSATDIPSFKDINANINSNFKYYVSSWGTTPVGSSLIDTGVYYSTVDVFHYNNYVSVGNSNVDYSTGSLFHQSDYVEGSDVDKLSLYELNMIDLDENRKRHQFNICTYTNSNCYDEIMEYYIKDYQYVIYLTDYERILTYQNYDDDDSFLYGSYVISGYIDYLITDDAFFYFSEYYNQVLSDSGTTFFNKNKEDYTKRFYFKLTYSEDSNDPHATIWEDNGNLFKIDYLQSFEDRYFVGSSQTIYYANENSKGEFKSLTDDIYYLGYLNPTGGKTRDISILPFYVYNFDFAGGITELYIVNQNDYDYEEIINSRYDNWDKYYDDWTIITDESMGGSYIQGNDFTSSTFPKGSVNDNTSTENDESYIGDIRTASGDTDVIDRDKENKNNISNGSAISNLLDNIKNKFSFSNNIINNANEIKDYIENTQETHKYYLNINHKYLSGNVCIIDLSWYEQYKPTADAFICAFAYLGFIWHMFVRIPNLINGASASSYMSDINTYINKKGG